MPSISHMGLRLSRNGAINPPMPSHIYELPAVGGALAGSLLIGYRPDLYAYAIEGGERLHYRMVVEDEQAVWRYVGAVDG